MDDKEAHRTIQQAVALLAMTRQLMHHIADVHRACDTCHAIATEWIILEGEEESV